MSNTDSFDESQATKLGKLANAHKVVISVVTLVGGRNMLSIKLIDVETATIDQQKVRTVVTNDLLDAVEPLTAELLGEPTNSPSNNNSKNKPVKEKETIKPDPKEQQIVGGDVSLYFAGFTSNKNPAAKVYVDGILVGTGTLNRGFSLSFSESYSEKHSVKIEWESIITTKTYNIDTNFKKQFEFEYAKGGFGYEFRLKN
jgi:hypothetical protein